MPDTTSPNYVAAVTSFLRVLAVAVASALAPMFVGAEDFPTGKALAIAAAASTLLTVINFFGSWETRYGTPPNPGADAGRTDIGFIFAVLFALAAVAFAFAGNVTAAVVFAVVAVAIFLLL